MKLSKELLTVIIAQVVAVAAVVAQRMFAPDDLALAITAIGAVESIAVALVVHFVAAGKISEAQAKIEALTREVKIVQQGK